MLTKKDIAIVGMACRFPKANNIAAFWQLLLNDQSTIEQMKEERWNLDKFYDPDPSTPNKSHQKHGSFLDDIHHFDPLLFNISPAEAIEMAPSQKLMLELTWEAIESNNLAFDEIAGKKVGVYIGNVWNDFEHYRKHLNANTTLHSAIGQSTSVIANRVSYTFGFTGPSLVVDTGCSSSLVALHLACQSIWEGSSDVSIVGGINHILDHDQYILLSKFGGLSKNNQCSTFSEDADGFVRGEGAGIVLLKRLEDAERDGDNIIALVKGSSINNNGFNINLPATSQKGQTEMLEQAYDGSGIKPADVHYIEAHGTGTKLGDPTETKAIGQFFAKDRSEKKPLRIGSVKTNIGHMEAAAGMAGLLKVLLSMQHKQIPASLNFKKPNPEIPFEALKLKVNNTLAPWDVKANETRKAGVNSFGWGGTNAHAVVEEYISPNEVHDNKPVNTNVFLLNISAKSEHALKSYAKRYAAQIAQAGTAEEIAKICIATAVNKPKLNYRLSIAGETRDELILKLQEFVETGAAIPPDLDNKAKVVFIFPGQGSQWLGMGSELYRKEQKFKHVIDECEQAFKPHVNWSLKEQVFATKENSRLKEIDVIQPFLFAMEIALARLWMDKGLQPDAVVGHSMGEVASAHISGAISLEDAANIICSRSKLMKTVSNTGGAMAVTELSVAQAEQVVARYQGKLSVAVSNSPKSTVIAGNEVELLEVLEDLEEKGLFCRQVKVDVASHSPQMNMLMPPLHKQLSGMAVRENLVPFYSTVLNKEMAGIELTEDYWVKNLRGMVRFSEVIDNLTNLGHTVFVEMSPHPVLTNAINECAEKNDIKVATIASILREKPEELSFMGNVGRLFEKGYDINWKAFYGIKKAPPINLPAYPMHKQNYALEDRSAQKSNGFTSKNPLLGRRVNIAGIDNVFIWENKLSLEHLSFVKDYQVNNTAVLPGVSYLEILYAALQDAFGNAFHQVESLEFKMPVFLPENASVDTQLKIVRNGQKKAVFTYYIKSTNSKEAEWETSAIGTLKICGSRERVSNDYLYNLNRTSNDTLIQKEEFYKVTDAIGIKYGNLFQGINWILINNKQAIAHIMPNSMFMQNDNQYFIHPAILDSCFQTIFTPVHTLGKLKANYTTFLSQLKGFRWFNKPEKGDSILVKAELKGSIQEPNGITKQQVSLHIYDESGNFLADLALLEAIIIDNDKKQINSGISKDWLYRESWETIHLDIPNQNEIQKTWLIFEDHLGVEKKLRQLFKRDNNKLIKVGPGDDFLKIDEEHYLVNFQDAQSIVLLVNQLKHQNIAIDGIIHAASLNDHISYEKLLAEDLDRIQYDGSVLLINLHKAILQLNNENKEILPKLFLLTNGLQPQLNKNSNINVAQASMWGLSKVLFNEEPKYDFTRVDISYFPDEVEISKFYELLAIEEIKEPEILIRNGEISGARLIQESLPAFNIKKVSFSASKTFVVTGVDESTLAFLDWIIEKGVKHIALIKDVGKTNGAVRKVIESFKKQGIDIQEYIANISACDQLANVFELVGHKMPQIGGIVHASQSNETKLISDLSIEEFFKAIAIKMKGTWNLHTLSLRLPIEHFIMFSSATSWLGLRGQGGLIAGNTFIDYFTHYRQKLGLPSTVINWGEIKTNKYEEEEGCVLADGLIPFEIKEGLKLFDELYSLAPTQIGIANLAIDTITERYESLAKTNYFEKLLTSVNANRTQEEQLQMALNNHESAEILPLVKQILTKKVAEITKASMDLINGSSTFKGLGIDSLMSIRLRNQLEKSLNLKIAVNAFKKHPSVNQFSDFIFQSLTEGTASDLNTQATWWVSHTKPQQPSIYLYCFHDAGANSSLYDEWSELHPSIELRAIELPGRSARLEEEPITNMKYLVELIANEIQQQQHNKIPYAFFGHSMGGAIAFEVMKLLRHRKQRLPYILFTSSTPALFSYDKSELSNQMSDEELIERFPHLSAANIDDENLRQNLIYIMRSDLQLLDSFNYEKEQPFNIPIVSLRGKDDHTVSLQQVQRWEAETILKHEVIERNGAHRYLVNDSYFVSRLVNDKLNSLLAVHN